MAEVEQKKKKLSRRNKVILGFLGIALVGFLGFKVFNAYRKVQVATRRMRETKPENVNPAQVSPETVASAIGKSREQPKSSTIPPPPEENTTNKQVNRKGPEKGSEGQKKETEWNLPKPKGSLTRLPKHNFSEGLPSPSGRLFPRSFPMKKEKVVEKMRVITPRLTIAQPKKAETEQVKPVAVQKKESFTTAVAAGMFVPATLSQGIMAPISYKVPVRFKLTGEAVGVGDYSFNLNSCVVLGVGKGIETGNSARIEVELVKLACQWPDGKLHTVPVTGYVIDRKDGKLHLTARLEENESRTVFESFLQGAAMGAAEAAKKSQEVTQTTALNQNTSIESQGIKNKNAYILWGGAAGALSQTQQILQQKIQKLASLQAADREPGGKVYLVFTQDLKVPEGWLKPKSSRTYDFAGYERW